MTRSPRGRKPRVLWVAFTKDCFTDRVVWWDVMACKSYQKLYYPGGHVAKFVEVLPKAKASKAGRRK